MRATQRIVFFIPSFAGGGAERATILLARSLAKRADVEVALVVPTTEGPLLSEAESSGVEIVDLGTGRVRYSVPSLARYIAYARPHVLVAAPNDTAFFAYWARSLSRVDGVSLVGILHNAGSMLFSERSMSHLARRTALRWALERVDLVVCVSEGVKRDLLTKLASPRRTEVVVDPVDFTRILRGARQPISHRWFGNGNQVVLAVGRLTSQKDFPTLIEAFAIVNSELPRSRLLILGEGPLRLDLEQLIESKSLDGLAEIGGFVDNPWAYMARSELLVLSSLYEGLGLVLIEALACGTAVVSTDCPYGPAEVLDDGRLGTLVPVGEPVLMADAIVNAITAPMTPPAVDELLASYSPDSVTEHFLRAVRRGTKPMP